MPKRQLHSSGLVANMTNTVPTATAAFWPSHLKTTPRNSTLQSGTNDLGEFVPCVGPTPPPNLTFPIETVVQKIFEADGPTTEAIFKYDSKSGFWTTSTCTAATTVYSTWTRQQVPQLNPYMGDSRPCCGMCTVYVSLVDLYYWPVQGASTACVDGTGRRVAGPASSSTFPSLPSNHNNTISTTVGSDGYT